MDTEKQYELEELAGALGVSTATLRRQAQRANIPAIMSLVEARRLVATYAEPRASRPEAVVEAAKAWMMATTQYTTNVQVVVNNGQHGGQLATPGNDNDTRAPKWRGNVGGARQGYDNAETMPEQQAGAVVKVARSEAVAVVVLLAALSWQVFNTAEVAAWISTGQMQADARSYLFAVPAQLAAFLMTIRAGRGKAYLRAFMAFEVAINMLHYRPWAAGGGVEIWMGCCLLSVFGPYVIYSFSVLLANRK